MSGSPETPDGRENPTGITQAGQPYAYPDQYPYQPGPYPAGYPPPPNYGYPSPPAAPKNGLGITSLVLAVIALVSVATVVGPIVLGVGAIVVGFFGHGRVKRGVANNGGVAISGIALGALAIIVGLAFVAIWTTVWKDVGGGNYIDCMQNAGSDQFKLRRCEDQFRQNVEDRLSVTMTPPIR